MPNIHILEKIINSINTPIVIINNLTKEYEWLNEKAKKIIENLKIDFDYLNTNQTIIDNQLYQITNLELENNKKAIILEPSNQAFIDNETELLNFKGFFIKYETIYSILRRKKKNLAIAIVEIDRFDNLIKNLNYQETIKISKKIAEIIKNKIRNNIDIISRYSSQSFLLAIVEVEKEKLQKILERIQKSVIEFFKKEQPFILTTSITSTYIYPQLQKSEEILQELQEKIKRILYTLEYEKKIKQNFIYIID